LVGLTWATRAGVRTRRVRIQGGEDYQKSGLCSVTNRRSGRRRGTGAFPGRHRGRVSHLDTETTRRRRRSGRGVCGTPRQTA